MYVTGDETGTEEWKAKRIIKSLFEFFGEYPDKIPGFYKKQGENFSKEQKIADYIAGMTDQYAVYVYSEYFIPKSFSHS